MEGKKKLRKKKYLQGNDGPTKLDEKTSKRGDIMKGSTKTKRTKDMMWGI
jgi:hypothetical protein